MPLFFSKVFNIEKESMRYSMLFLSMFNLKFTSTDQDMIIWDQRIKSRAKSRLSVSEWCKLNEIRKIGVIGVIK